MSRCRRFRPRTVLGQTVVALILFTWLIVLLVAAVQGAGR